MAILEMNARERKLLTVLAVVGALVLLLALPFGVEAVVRSERSDNDEIRQALADVQDARDRVRDRQVKKDAIAARYARKAPALAGYLEQTARQQKLDVTETTPLPDVPHGKRYVEHGTNIHLRKTGMLPFAKFVESLEKSGYPISISRLDIRKRSGENDSYDIDLGVSSYDRSEAAPATAGSAKP